MYLWEIYQGKDYNIIPTLDRIHKAVEYIGLSNPSFVSFQVGGTNGKGSTCAFLESLLRHHGYKTGWFVSPHLFQEVERWKINAQNISEETLSCYVRDLKSIFEKFHLTYFEACTLIAMKYFEDEKVDFAVFEVGMGGRWDATKVCNPQVCCITNIGRDHIKWLGNNPEERAKEKLGIYIKGKPLIIGSMKYPLYTTALEVCNREDLVVAGLDFQAFGKVERERTYLSFYSYKDTTFKDLTLSLWGKWQIDNASLALTAALQVLKLQEEKVKEALSKARWEGRMEIVREKPLLILDGAHNPDGVRLVVENLKRHFNNIKPLFTGLKDKEWKTNMQILKELSQTIYLVKLQHHRAESLENLLGYAKELGLKAVILESIQDALSIEDDIIVLGSLYLVGEVKKALAFAKQ